MQHFPRFLTLYLPDKSNLFPPGSALLLLPAGYEKMPNQRTIVVHAVSEKYPSFIHAVHGAAEGCLFRAQVAQAPSLLIYEGESFGTVLAKAPEQAIGAWDVQYHRLWVKNHQSRDCLQSWTEDHGWMHKPFLSLPQRQADFSIPAANQSCGTDLSIN